MAEPVKLNVKAPPPFRRIEMSVSDWIEVPDNPVQRDTEAHLRGRGKHVLDPKPTHAHVAMCEDPKGRRWKADGHSRGLAWQRGLVMRPPILYVDVYPVRDAAGAAEIYKLFDSKDAVETAAQQVSGAYRYNAFTPTSRLLSRNVLANAVRLADGFSRGQRRASQPKDIETHKVVELWLEELKLLDSLDPVPRRFPGPLVTAALMTFRKHEAKAKDFWRLYSDDAGEKLKDVGMDPVEALSRFQLEARVVGGPTEMVGKALAAFEAHRENRIITRNLTALDPARYMIRAKLK